MPAIKLKSTKAGVEYYEIRVSLGRGKSQPTTRWYPPEGWSKRAIDRELTKVAADFERRCKEGEILSRKDAKEKAIQGRENPNAAPVRGNRIHALKRNYHERENPV